MNTPTEIILKSFGETDQRAQECLHERSSSLSDMRWAYNVLIAEKVLLAAFRETPETSGQEIDVLFTEAKRKLHIPRYIEVIAESEIARCNIAPTHQPTLRQIQNSVYLGFEEVIESFREEAWYETLKKKPAFREAKKRERRANASAA